MRRGGSSQIGTGHGSPHLANRAISRHGDPRARAARGRTDRSRRAPPCGLPPSSDGLQRWALAGADVDVSRRGLARSVKRRRLARRGGSDLAATCGYYRTRRPPIAAPRDAPGGSSSPARLDGARRDRRGDGRRAGSEGLGDEGSAFWIAGMAAHLDPRRFLAGGPPPLARPRRGIAAGAPAVRPPRVGSPSARDIVTRASPLRQARSRRRRLSLRPPSRWLSGCW